jgi:hypothetical protein
MQIAQPVVLFISNIPSSNANNADKRRELSSEDYPAIARLILGGLFRQS